MSPRPVKAHQHTDPRDSPKLNQVEANGEALKRIHTKLCGPKPETNCLARLLGDDVLKRKDGKADEQVAEHPTAVRAKQAARRKKVLRALNAFALLQATLRRKQSNTPPNKGILRGKPAARIVPIDLPRKG